VLPRSHRCDVWRGLQHPFDRQPCIAILCDLLHYLSASRSVTREAGQKFAPSATRQLHTGAVRSEGCIQRLRAVRARHGCFLLDPVLLSLKAFVARVELPLPIVHAAQPAERCTLVKGASFCITHEALRCIVDACFRGVIGAEASGRSVCGSACNECMSRQCKMCSTCKQPSRAATLALLLIIVVRIMLICR
jgi:hypothetical protein